MHFSAEPLFERIELRSREAIAAPFGEGAKTRLSRPGLNRYTSNLPWNSALIRGRESVRRDRLGNNCDNLPRPADTAHCNHVVAR